MPKASGGKITGSHTTMIDAAVDVVDKAQMLPEVSKIGLGIIHNQVGTGKQRIQFKNMTGGWLVMVRGSATIQELRIYTSDKVVTREELFRCFHGVRRKAPVG